MKAADTDISKIQYYQPFLIIKPIIGATLPMYACYVILHNNCGIS